MKMFWVVSLAFLSISAYAESNLSFDEELITQEVVSIMRSRGVEPYPFVTAQRRNVFHFLVQRCTTRAKRSIGLPKKYLLRSMQEKPVQSIQDRYALGFVYLQAGMIKEAHALWCEVALQYPQSVAEELLVKSALELTAQPHVRFPILHIRKQMTHDAADTVFLLAPLHLSSLFAAFLKG